MQVIGKTCSAPWRTRALVQGTAVAVVFAFSAAAADDVDAGDSEFLQSAIQSDIAEVKLSELALQRSNDDAIRDLAHRLQTDHSVSMQEAAALAKDLGTRVPSVQSDSAAQHYASLVKLSGPEFDAAFVEHTVGAHRDAVTKFDAAVQEHTNDEIARFAAKTLPTLKEHLVMSEALQSAGENRPADALAAPSKDAVDRETAQRYRANPQPLAPQPNTPLPQR